MGNYRVFAREWAACCDIVCFHSGPSTFHSQAGLNNMVSWLVIRDQSEKSKNEINDSSAREGKEPCPRAGREQPKAGHHTGNPLTAWHTHIGIVV